MLCLSGFELYSRWVPRSKVQSHIKDQSPGGGGGTSHMKGVGMLVRNFELNPYGDRSGRGSSFFRRFLSDEGAAFTLLFRFENRRARERTERAGEPLALMVNKPPAAFKRNRRSPKRK